MDHRSIDEEAVAELYVIGRLDAAAQAVFEEHLLECRECRDRVTWAEELHGSLHEMAKDDRRRTAGRRPLTWLTPPRRVAHALLAAGLLLALALPGWLLLERARLRHELALARAAAQPRASAPASRTSPATGGTTAVAGEGSSRDRLLAQLREKEETLREERRKTEELSARLAELSGPQINAALFSLGAVRGEGEQNRVAIGTHPTWLVLSIELPAPGGGPYSATLLDGHGRAVWSGSGLRPTVSDTVLLGLFSRLLSPGDYRLVLVGTGTSPQRIEVSFVVTREPSP
jgi:hypothetical protein